MAHVVTENCILCKYGTCVEVCPVVCFHEGNNFLVINPSECIDCGMCVPACNANAIYSMTNLPVEQQEFVEINEKLSLLWPAITSITRNPNHGDHWNGKKDKIKFLDPIK